MMNVSTIERIARQFCFQASAAFSLSIHQPAAADDSRATAVAAAEPQQRTASTTAFFQNDEHGESSASQICARNSLVSALHSRSGPMDVVRFVVLVIVQTIEAMPRRWSTTDISEKGVKGIEPRLVYANATTAPILVTLAVAVVAASLHLLPCSVFRRPLTPVALGLSMPEVLRCCHFAAKTSATGRLSATKFLNSDRNALSAVALTPNTPAHSARIAVGIHGQPAKALSVHVDACGHIESVSQVSVMSLEIFRYPDGMAI